MRKIDCAHFRSFENSGKLVNVRFSLQYTLLFPWIRAKEALGLILCGESIARIPEALKCFPDSDSGWVFVLKRKFWVFCKNHLFGGNFMRGIYCAHSRNFKMLSWKLVHVWYLLQYTLLFPWIRVKEAFSRIGNVHNRFLS